MKFSNDQPTWRELVAAINEEFATLFGQNTPDDWYELLVNQYCCENVCESFDNCYPLSLIAYRCKDRSIWNLWRGKRTGQGMFAMGIDDWGGGGVKVQVSKPFKEEVLPRLESIKHKLHMTFVVELLEKA